MGRLAYKCFSFVSLPIWDGTVPLEELEPALLPARDAQHARLTRSHKEACVSQEAREVWTRASRVQGTHRIVRT